MARPLIVVALAACLAGCGASALTLALKALAIAVDVAREVHDHHLDGGSAECTTPARDAAVDE
jgi:hypothetical protein